MIKQIPFYTEVRKSPLLFRSGFFMVAAGVIFIYQATLLL